MFTFSNKVGLTVALLRGPLMQIVIGVVVGTLVVGFLRKQFPTLPF